MFYEVFGVHVVAVVVVVAIVAVVVCCCCPCSWRCLSLLADLDLEVNNLAPSSPPTTSLPKALAKTICSSDAVPKTKTDPKPVSLSHLPNVLFLPSEGLDPLLPLCTPVGNFATRLLCAQVSFGVGRLRCFYPHDDRKHGAVSRESHAMHFLSFRIHPIARLNRPRSHKCLRPKRLALF